MLRVHAQNFGVSTLNGSVPIGRLDFNTFWIKVAIELLEVVHVPESVEFSKQEALSQTGCCQLTLRQIEIIAFVDRRAGSVTGDLPSVHDCCLVGLGPHQGCFLLNPEGLYY